MCWSYPRTKEVAYGAGRPNARTENTMSEEVELMLLADVRSLEITLASKSRHLAEAQAKAAGFERDWYAAKSEFGTAMAKIREALRAAEKRELEALAELDEAKAEITRLRWGEKMACENTPNSSCECSGCETARADTDAKVKAEWEKLFNERNRLWREEADRVGAVKLLLEANGCDCDCDHDAESHDADCDRCLACRISWAIET